MGLRTRTFPGIRRATHCGGRAHPCFSGRWRDRIRFEQSTNSRGVTVQVAPRFLLAEEILPGRRLLADDGDFRFGNFEPDETMSVVEKEQDLEVGGADLEAFVRFAVGGGRAGGEDFYGARR